MNKSFIRINLVNFLMIGLAVFALAGCDQKNGNLKPQDTGVAEPKTLITLAVQSSEETKEIESRLAQFNAAHQGFYVELVNLPRDRYDETLNMRMTSGEGPDVFQIGIGWLATYTYKNYLLDLSKAVDEKIVKAFPDWVMNYTKHYDSFYAIPSGMMTLRLIYNKDLLASAGYDPEHPPISLLELKSYANKISQANTGYRKYGFALPAGEDLAGFQQALEMASTYSGVYYYNFAHVKYDFSVYTAWFQMMLTMKQEGGLFPGETSLKSDTALAQFAEGNIGMMYITNHDFALLNQMKPMQFSWGIAMPPLLKPSDQGKGALMVYPDSPMVINANTSHKEEAVELWEFLHSREYLGAVYKQGDAIPTLKEVTDDPQFQPLLPKFNNFLLNSNESPYPREPKFILQNVPNQFTPRNLGDAVRMKAYRDILQGLQSPEAMLQELTVQYNHSLDSAVINNRINLNDYMNPAFNPKHPLK
jgi:multiple sugar transport system substrate-binding protein